ncbi:MAG: siphovirus ReqiPepy6 Gp37-like family protein [Oscillospiraceae bacterium]|nr:siphovirus ReqiPepy6 Gp37-like family protein [Oscillospiraceae bacterium]
MRSDAEVRLYAYRGAGLPYDRIGTSYKCAVKWTQRYSATGAFSITVPAGERISRAMERGVFVEIGRRFYGVIDEVSRTHDAGGDMLTASGTDFLGLLERRVTIPPDWPGGTALMGFDAVSGSSETIIKHFVTGNAAAPFLQSRAIPGLQIAPDLERGRPDDRYMTRYANLMDVISEIAEDAGLGITIKPDFDAGTMTFDVYEGAERLAVVSTERGTTLDMRNMESDVNYRNIFYASMSGSEFADETLTMQYAREGDPPNGFERRELHMSISASHPEPGEEYNELRRMAEVNMTNYEPLKSLTCEVNPSRLELGRDYELGDILTAQNHAWGVTSKVRAAAITAEHTGRGGHVTVHFGDERPGLLVRAYWRRKPNQQR